MQTWEYLGVALTMSKELEGHVWQVVGEITVTHPSGATETVGGAGNWFEVLNRFGAEGWELVGEVVHERSTGVHRGFDHVALTIQTTATMKRPVPPVQAPA